MIPNGPRTGKSYYATDLKCPKENSGVLEFSMRTPQGDLTRIWVNYSGALPVKIKMVITPAGRTARTTIDVGLDVAMDELARDTIRDIRSETDWLYEAVCSGSASAKARYDAMVIGNRNFLNGAK